MRFLIKLWPVLDVIFRMLEEVPRTIVARILEVDENNSYNQVGFDS